MVGALRRVIVHMASFLPQGCGNREPAKSSNQLLSKVSEMEFCPKHQLLIRQRNLRTTHRVFRTNRRRLQHLVLHTHSLLLVEVAEHMLSCQLVLMDG